VVITMQVTKSIVGVICILSLICLIDACDSTNAEVRQFSIIDLQRENLTYFMTYFSVLCLQYYL